jgi:deoxyhypusine monooxygenase
MNLSKEEAMRIIDNPESKSVFVLEAMFKLMNIADKESMRYLYKVLKNHKCEVVRHEAAFCIGETASEEAVSILKEVCDIDNSIVVKHECLLSIGTLGSKKDIPFLEKYLSHDLFEVKSSAKVAIERINQTNFYEDFNNKVYYYIEKLKDTENTLQNDRIQILFHLMLLGDDKSIEAIRYSLLNDPCRIVRHEAAFVLGEVANKKACDVLVESLHSEKVPMVIHEALFALGTAGKKEYLKEAERFLDDPEYIVRESAKIAVDRLTILDKPYNGREEYNYLN